MPNENYSSSVLATKRSFLPYNEILPKQPLIVENKITFVVDPRVRNFSNALRFKITSAKFAERVKIAKDKNFLTIHFVGDLVNQPEKQERFYNCDFRPAMVGSKNLHIKRAQVAQFFTGLALQTNKTLGREAPFAHPSKSDSAKTTPSLFKDVGSQPKQNLGEAAHSPEGEPAKSTQPALVGDNSYRLFLPPLPHTVDVSSVPRVYLSFNSSLDPQAFKKRKLG